MHRTHEPPTDLAPEALGGLAVAALADDELALVVGTLRDDAAYRDALVDAYERRRPQRVERGRDTAPADACAARHRETAARQRAIAAKLRGAGGTDRCP